MEIIDRIKSFGGKTDVLLTTCYVKRNEGDNTLLHSNNSMFI